MGKGLIKIDDESVLCLLLGSIYSCGLIQTYICTGMGGL